MTSSRPYLIRALYDWICDNQMTPHLVIDAQLPGVEVPTQAIRNGKVTLNVSPEAVQGLTLGDDEVTFQARFGGVSQAVRAPVLAVMAIYARENGKGMMFPPEEDGPEPAPEGEKEPSSQRPHLKVIK